MKKYIFWNNKGGTGKTSLTFQTICRCAALNPTKKYLAIDVCPQSNLSELFLGGQVYGGPEKLTRAYFDGNIRRSIGGYFDYRLTSPFQAIGFNSSDYIIKPDHYNENIPNNIDLLAGDTLLELQSLVMSALANTKMPGKNSQFTILQWLNDFLLQLQDHYDYVFIDTNPSFSMYTQIALTASDYVVIPAMPDDSSRRAIQNALSLLYGIKLPSEVYKEYTFSEVLSAESHPIPQIHLIIKNRITQYMGNASAYSGVLAGIDNDIQDAMNSYPNYFTFSSINDGIISVRDFQSGGIASFARATPFHALKTGKIQIGKDKTQRTQITTEQITNPSDAIDQLMPYFS